MATYKVTFEGYAEIDADSLEEAKEIFRNRGDCLEVIEDEEWEEIDNEI